MKKKLLFGTGLAAVVMAAVAAACAAYVERTLRRLVFREEE